MYCKVNGTSIFYEECGRGMPMLCIHGFPEDHRVMTGCVEPILHGSGSIRRIYIDLPGMGRSPAPSSTFRADKMLEVVEALIRAVIGDEPFLLVGQSYGGYLSLGLLQRIPEQVAGAYLLCPCTVADRAKRRLPPKRISEHQVPPSIREADREAYVDFLDYTAVVTPETWERYKAEVLPGLMCADSGFVEAYQGNGYGFSFEEDLRATLRFGSPVCFFTGAADTCVGYEDAYALLPGFSRATFVVADGAGHNAQIECPDFFAATFRDFLSRVLAK